MDFKAEISSPKNNRKLSKRAEKLNELKEYKINNNLNPLDSMIPFTSPNIENLNQNELVFDEEFDTSSIHNIRKLSKETKHADQTIVLGICGGSDSGKSLISNLIKEKLKDYNYTSISILEKNFIIDPLEHLDIKSDSERDNILKNHDFDTPEAINWKLFEDAVEHLKNRKPYDCPIYDFSKDQKLKATEKLKPSNLIIVEGRLFLNNQKIRDMCNLRLFLQTDKDIMVSRRIYKNIARGKKIEDIIDRYQKFVKPAYEEYIEPVKVYSNFVIHNFGGYNFQRTEFNDDNNIISNITDMLLIKFNNYNK